MNDERQYDIGARFANPGISLMLGFSLLIICVMFSSFVGGWLVNVFGGEANTFDELMQHNRGLYRGIQALSNLISWGLAAAFWAIYTGGFRKQLGLQQPIWKGYFPLAAMTILVALPFVEWLLIDASAFHLPESMKGIEQWALSRETNTGGSIISLLGDTSFTGLTANIVVFAVIPAISEELFFRGFLLGTLKRWMGLHTAVWVSAILFSLLHFQFLGFFSRMVLGALLGYFFVYSGNLWASIAAHFVHNLTNIILAVLAIRGVISQDFLESTFGFGAAMTIASFVLTIVLLYVYFDRAKKLQSTLQYE